MLNVPEYIVVHHTGGTSANPRADTSHHTFEIVDAYHKSLKWEGFGYHYFIAKDGGLRAGRAENYQGAHVKTMNARSLGICLAGNFDVTLPTEKQIASLTGLLKGILGRYNIPRENIVPHRHFTAKSCYGGNLPDDWAAKLISEDTRKAQVLAALDSVKELYNKLYP
jgi:N-acetyl-anhydromuramyl-L-alanine amidase AmpD